MPVLVPVPGNAHLQLSRDQLVVDLLGGLGPWPEYKGRMMDRTVALLVAAVALFGTAIGLRFRVYILIPALLAVLIVSVIAQLLSNNMAGWGAQGTLGLLVLLNASYVLGLLLRAAAAFWSTKRSVRLFARTGSLNQPMRGPDGAGRETGSEGRGPKAAIAPADLAKESFRR